jgi:group I intron endonuclease
MDISLRWNGHRRELRKRRHGNAYLQNAWNCYGESSFRFLVLGFCKCHELDEREQYWIERLSPEYNIAKNIYEWWADTGKKENCPDGYTKSGESFERPVWHLWVYGGYTQDQVMKSLPKPAANDQLLVIAD